MRPSKLPAFEEEFGKGQPHVRQRAPDPLRGADLVADDAGRAQHDVRVRDVRHRAGQYWSPFMDIDIFPNSVEYWGPTGMVFFRNVHVRWIPIRSDTRQVMLGIERPGASNDAGRFEDRIELQGVTGQFRCPMSRGTTG
jgi:hypothetical protein